MLIGIIANITKENVFEVVSSFISKLKKNKLDYILTKSLLEDKDKLKIELFDDFITDDKELYENADLIISIGGDGTMLATAFNAQFYDKPVLGVNLGKLAGDIVGLSDPTGGNQKGFFLSKSCGYKGFHFIPQMRFHLFNIRSGHGLMLIQLEFPISHCVFYAKHVFVSQTLLKVE